MADDPVPFVLAGEVSDWRPETRVLYIGETRLEVAPGVAVEALTPRRRVTVTGYHSKREFVPWVVTEIRAYRPSF